MKFFHLALAGSVVLGFRAYAQVSPSTPADVAGVPAQFLPNSKVGPGGFAPKSTPAGYKLYQRMGFRTVTKVGVYSS